MGGHLVAGNDYHSWGHYPRTEQQLRRLNWRHQDLPLAGTGDQTILPFGNGRSYGDSCLNDKGWLLDCRGLNRMIAFDRDTGVLRCEAGVMLDELLDLIVPAGWFLPVTPGTQFITIGGAIANDVHGKNHHRVGTFGRFVRRFELLRSDGTRLQCSPDENAPWFEATIGGLGLTGVITWAEIQMRSIHNRLMDHETIRYDNLDEFFTLARDSDQDYEYTVAWIDCLASGDSLGRGLFMRANHAERGPATPTPRSLKLSVPIQPPFSLLNKWTLKAFNGVYYNKQRHKTESGPVDYVPFFYPLDAVNHWNRIYGPKGFFQYQCVLPFEHGEAAIREILTRIAGSGTGSFLAVLKLFGDLPSPGLFSFPREGITLALDFPNRGLLTHKLLDDLDDVTREAAGSVYPCKDARMRAEDFRHWFPQWQAMQEFIDPRFSSSFWRRVTHV